MEEGEPRNDSRPDLGVTLRGLFCKKRYKSLAGLVSERRRAYLFFFFAAAFFFGAAFFFFTMSGWFEIQYTGAAAHVHCIAFLLKVVYDGRPTISTFVFITNTVMNTNVNN